MFSFFFISTSEYQTQRLSTFLFKVIHFPIVLFLDGDIGSGKTIFIKKYITCFTKKEIPLQSPTYSILKSYKTSPPFHHFDLYKIESFHSIHKKYFSLFFLSKQMISCIEWPRYFNFPLNKYNYLIQFKTLSKNTRLIRFFYFNKNVRESLYKL